MPLSTQTAPAVPSTNVVATGDRGIYHHARHMTCCPLCGESNAPKGSICNRAIQKEESRQQSFQPKVRPPHPHNWKKRTIPAPAVYVGDAQIIDCCKHCDAPQTEQNKYESCPNLVAAAQRQAARQQAEASQISTVKDPSVENITAGPGRERARERSPFFVQNSMV
jgi:hypothetical protein